MVRGRPKKYQQKSEAIAAYHKTDKGKQAVQRYENSPKGKERKRNWWQENKDYAKARRQQQFIETYGLPERVLPQLSEIERQVLILYYGLQDGMTHTLEEIATRLNLSSKQNVSRIKSKALKNISTKSYKT